MPPQPTVGGERHCVFWLYICPSSFNTCIECQYLGT